MLPIFESKVAQSGRFVTEKLLPPTDIGVKIKVLSSSAAFGTPLIEGGMFVTLIEKGAKLVSISPSLTLMVISGVIPTSAS